MPGLIEELKNEHRIILAILDEVKTLGIASKTGQEKLMSARGLLITHMKKEDEKYYPAFRRSAETSKDLKIMLDYFVTDMETVSARAMQLFDKYSHGGKESEFAGEFKILYMMLKDRIRTEEKTLFEKYSQLS